MVQIDDINVKKVVKLSEKILQKFRYLEITIDGEPCYDGELIINTFKAQAIPDAESFFIALVDIGVFEKRIEKRDVLYTSKIWG